MQRHDGAYSYQMAILRLNDFGSAIDSERESDLAKIACSGPSRIDTVVLNLDNSSIVGTLLPAQSWLARAARRVATLGPVTVGRQLQAHRISARANSGDTLSAKFHMKMYFRLAVRILLPFAPMALASTSFLRLLSFCLGLGLSACGGAVDQGQSADPSGSGSDAVAASGNGSQLLSDCKPGFPKSQASTDKPCNFLAGDTCYSTQNDACGCICPRDQGSVMCVTGRTIPNVWRDSPSCGSCVTPRRSNSDQSTMHLFVGTARKSPPSLAKWRVSESR